MGSREIGTNTIKMITKDWRLIQRVLIEKHLAITEFDLESVSEDEAADMCEDLDQISGILSLLSTELDEHHQQAIAS